MAYYLMLIFEISFRRLPENMISQLNFSLVLKEGELVKKLILFG